LHSLFNLVAPVEDKLAAIPLFPTRAKGPIFSPFDYDGLGKLVRRVMSWVFHCKAIAKNRVLCLPHILHILFASEVQWPYTMLGLTVW
jgi:hypothetical protein